MKIRPVEAELFRAARHDDARSRFSQSGERARKRWLGLTQSLLF
jgi:hypothetical protein